MPSFRATAFCFALRLRFDSRCRVLDSAPNTYRGSRPVALGDTSGKATAPSRPRSSSVPSCRPPHDVDLVGVRCLQARGRGRVASDRAHGARRSREGAGARVQSSAAGCRATALTTGSLLALAGARKRCGLLELRPLRLPLDDGLTAPAPSAHGREEALGIERLPAPQHEVGGPPELVREDAQRLALAEALLELRQQLLALRAVTDEQHRGLREGPLQVHVAHLGPTRPAPLARG